MYYLSGFLKEEAQPLVVTFGPRLDVCTKVHTQCCVDSIYCIRSLCFHDVDIFGYLVILHLDRLYRLFVWSSN